MLQATYGGREVDVAYDGLVETTPGTIITRDMWRWAWTIVASRSFSFTYVGGASPAQIEATTSTQASALAAGFQSVVVRVWNMQG